MGLHSFSLFHILNKMFVREMGMNYFTMSKYQIQGKITEIYN